MTEEKRISQESPSGDEGPSGGESGGVAPSGSAEGAEPTDQDLREMVSTLGTRFEEQGKTLERLGKMLESRTDKLERLERERQQVTPSSQPQPSQMDMAVQTLAQQVMYQQPGITPQQAYQQAQTILQPAQSQYAMGQIHAEQQRIQRQQMEQATERRISEHLQKLGLDRDTEGIDFDTEDGFYRSSAELALKKQKKDLETTHASELKTIRNDITKLTSDHQRTLEEHGVYDVVGVGHSPATASAIEQRRRELEEQVKALRNTGREQEYLRLKRELESLPTS